MRERVNPLNGLFQYINVKCPLFLTANSGWVEKNKPTSCFIHDMSSESPIFHDDTMIFIEQHQQHHSPFEVIYCHNLRLLSYFSCKPQMTSLLWCHVGVRFWKPLHLLASQSSLKRFNCLFCFLCSLCHHILHPLRLSSLRPLQPHRPALLPLEAEEGICCLPPAVLTWHQAGGGSRLPSILFSNLHHRQV